MCSTLNPTISLLFHYSMSAVSTRAGPPPHLKGTHLRWRSSLAIPTKCVVDGLDMPLARYAKEGQEVAKHIKCSSILTLKTFKCDCAAFVNNKTSIEWVIRVKRIEAGGTTIMRPC